MDYKEGDWESVLFPRLSVRLTSVCFFLLFHISDADNLGKNRVNIYLFYTYILSKDFISATINYITLQR